MKLILLLTLSLNLLAGTLSTNQREANAILNLVASLEKDAWNRGHDHIEVETEKFNHVRFQKFLTTEMIHMEEVVLGEEVKDFTKCLTNKVCKLYKINVSSEFYAGFGFDYHFVMYDSLSGDIQIQTYVGYIE